jgi:aspartyl aminopeptidase
MDGFIRAEKSDSIAVLAVFDNEEVGSETKQGAASTFLYNTLTRINKVLGYDEEKYMMALSHSFMISADNAHAVHPAHPDKTDTGNRPYLNGGVVLKMNADQKYCTEGLSAAFFRELCNEADVPVQTFVNRSDMAGGSTLGNISSSQVAVAAVDIGVAQLAMHSSYETAGARDTEYLIKVFKKFFK